jgi:hypothetical protein
VLVYFGLRPFSNNAPPSSTKCLDMGSLFSMAYGSHIQACLK